MPTLVSLTALVTSRNIIIICAALSLTTGAWYGGKSFMLMTGLSQHKPELKPMAKSIVRLKGWLTLTLMLALISGCATSVPIPECSWSQAIYPSRADGLTRGTKEQILSQNKLWEKFCDTED